MGEFNVQIKEIINDYSWFISSISALLAVAMNFIIKKNELKRKNKYNADNEEFKLEINKHRQMFNESLAALSSTNELHYERSTKAIEFLWNSVQKIRKMTLRMSFIYSIFEPSEYQKYIEDNNLKSLILEECNLIEINNSFEEEIDKVRPFVESEVWNKYILYRTFSMRCLYMFSEGVRTNNILPWYSDKASFDIFESLMGEYKRDNYKSIGEFKQILMEMETLIVLEMQSVLKGHKLSNEIFNKSLEISKYDIKQKKMNFN